MNYGKFLPEKVSHLSLYIHERGKLNAKLDA